MIKRKIVGILGLAGAFVSSACSTPKDLVSMANELQEPRATELILREVQESLQKTNSNYAPDNSGTNGHSKPSNSDSFRKPVFDYSSLISSSGASNNNYLSPTTNYGANNRVQGVIDGAVAELDEGEKPDDGLAKRVALGILAGPNFGPVVDWAYRQADGVRALKKEYLEKPLSDYTGVKWGISISGGFDGRPDFGVKAKKNVRILGITGEFCLELRDQSSYDSLFNDNLTTTNPYEREIFSPKPWALVPGDYKDGTKLTLAYTIKF